MISYSVDTKWANKAQEYLKELGSTATIKATDSSITIDGKRFMLPKALKEPHSSITIDGKRFMLPKALKEPHDSMSRGWSKKSHIEMSIDFDDRIQDTLRDIVNQLVNVNFINKQHMELRSKIAQMAPKHDPSFSYLKTADSILQYTNAARQAADDIELLLEENKDIFRKHEMIHHLYSKDYTEVIRHEETNG